MGENENEDKKLLRKYAIVIASEHRRRVLELLGTGKVKTPKQIAVELGIHISHVSAALQKLREEGLVNCLNPDMRKGKLYYLTDMGKEVLRLLEEEGGR